MVEMMRHIFEICVGNRPQLLVLFLGAAMILSTTGGAAKNRRAEPVHAGTVFPEVSGSNLEKTVYNLPDDFEGKLNLIFVAFKREQQRLVDTWLGPARNMASVNEDLRYYELPTIHEANALLRWWIDNGMRKGIKDRVARETTITLYLDKQEFRSALGIPNEDDIYVFLVDADGNVLWQTNGAYTAKKAESLQFVIDRPSING